ncbi:MAG: hypothetical protein WD204_08195 [Acidimicrobiia bacterium]
MELRPRTVGEILDLAFKLYTSHIRKLLIIAAVVFIPIGIIQVFVTSGTDVDVAGLIGQLATAAQDGAIPPDLANTIAGLAVIELINFLASLFVIGASMQLFGSVAAQQNTDLTAALRFGVDESPRICLTAVLMFVGRYGAIISLGTIFGVLAGIGGSTIGVLAGLLVQAWLWVTWQVSIPVLLFERESPGQALSRSHRLVTQRFWPVAGTAILALIVATVVRQLIATVLAVVAIVPMALNAADTGSAGGNVFGVSVLAGSVASIVIVPFLAAVAVALYFDLRVRVEGFDLETLARQSSNLDIPPARNPRPDDTLGLD